MTPFQKVRRHIENDILEYAKRQSREDETPEQAFVRLIDERDPKVESLYSASNITKAIDEAVAHEAKSLKRQKAMQLMQDVAKSAKRTDETEAQAFARLLKTDRGFQETYEYYLEQAPW